MTRDGSTCQQSRSQFSTAAFNLHYRFFSTRSPTHKQLRRRRDTLDEAYAVLQAIGLAGKAEELAANLSHGEQRRLEIAVSLPEALLAVRLPAFSLQPIVENAIKRKLRRPLPSLRHR